MFQVIADRAEKAAVIVTTNLPFSEWSQVLAVLAMLVPKWAGAARGSAPPILSAACRVACCCQAGTWRNRGRRLVGQAGSLCMWRK
jgi:hypothetical protein